jgi:NADH-quinone oxidoreductase subunit J
VEITVESIVFLIFSVITLGGALLVVSSRNLFHAGLYLMATLFGVAGLFVLLSAPFLAGVQVVVYIGAIAILIILAIMLTPGVTRLTTLYTEQWPLNVAVAVIFFLMIVAVVTPLADELGVDNLNAHFTDDDPAAVPEGSIHTLGEDLVDPHGYMLPFELASLLLMASLVGAVLIVNPRDEGDATAAAPVDAAPVDVETPAV